LADFSTVLSWLKQAVPPQASASATVADPKAAELSAAGFRETPLRFGPKEHLFGMLCRPEHGAPDSVLIIGNGGRDPHYGAARHAVMLARRLARAGIASLRMDFAGLGDSLDAEGQEDVFSPLFSRDRTADIVEALDALAGLGFRRFGMTGLCAGSFHAFRAALVDARLSTLLLINLPFFVLPGGSLVDYLNWRSLSPSEALHRLQRLRSWRKLIDKRHVIGAILRVQAARLLAQARIWASSLAFFFGASAQPRFAQAAIARLSGRGVRMLFVFSPDEHWGWANAIEHEIGCSAEQLVRHYPGVAWRVFPKMDHDLSSVTGREAAEKAMIEFMVSSDAARRPARIASVNETYA